jgi:hypothetical protein
MIVPTRTIIEGIRFDMLKRCIRDAASVSMTVFLEDKDVMSPQLTIQIWKKLIGSMNVELSRMDTSTDNRLPWLKITADEEPSKLLYFKVHDKNSVSYTL